MNVNMDIGWTDFVDYINRSKSQLICYGAGLVGLATEDLFVKYSIANRVCCFSDKSKCGSTVFYDGRPIPVIDLFDFVNLPLAAPWHFDLEDKVILITLESFDAVIESLNRLNELRDTTCFIYPALNRSYIKDICSNNDKIISESQQQAAIPKTIHYCWFGLSEQPEYLVKSIETWKKYNSDYEIIRHDESNYDVRRNRYIEQAYQTGKYAFVTDYVRMDVLYQYGGIYLDADVEAVRSFDNLLCNTAFIKYNEWPVPNSSISGCTKGFDLFREIRDTREAVDFVCADGTLNKKINSFYEYGVLQKYGFIRDFSYQNINGLAVYPPKYFPQVGKLGLNANMTSCAYAIDHAVGSWKD